MILMYPHPYTTIVCLSNGDPAMIESYTEVVDKGVSVTLIPRDGIELKHTGIVSLPLAHPDASDGILWDAQRVARTTAELTRSSYNVRPSGFEPDVYVPGVGYANIVFEFIEQDPSFALIELRNIAQQFANRDTKLRRLAARLPDWLGAFYGWSWWTVAGLMLTSYAIDFMRPTSPVWLLTADCVMASAFLLLCVLGAIKHHGENT